MTNAEKYLKDGAGGVQDFTEALMKFNEERKFVTDWYAKAHSKDCIDLFLNEQVKPQLTEDERVILRNICFTPLKDFYIERRHGTLKLHNRVDELYDFFAYDHLFQFIKERRRI